ncbi:MAG: FAD-dependent oxidoreductase [Beijerinckiaceae bacterium]
MSAATPHAQYAYRRSPDQDRRAPAHHSVVIVGAGPVGLSLAIDLAQRGRNVVLLDDSDRIGGGSRAICFARRTLEIFDRLGVGDRMIEKGVTWEKGKVFQGEELLYEFNLSPEGGCKRPAFINLQQYYVEHFLASRAAELPQIDARWRNRVIAVVAAPDHVRLTIETPDGAYEMTSDWLIACDGARSTIRTSLGLEFAGTAFNDQFLIADVKMAADFPSERWFWFDPPFHSGKSALLHKQPDNVWRIDLQLGPEANAEDEKRPEAVRPRIERMLGRNDFELEWLSVYRFQCRRLRRFVHERVVFAGDAAHLVSPFGARGANSGVQDADNLGWKLDVVLSGGAGPTLIESYDIERAAAADENIRHSTSATDFIAPHSGGEARWRNAALSLARDVDFAKRFVNSGRLSTASSYRESPLSTPDAETWPGALGPGDALPDAPLQNGSGEPVWLSDVVGAAFSEICLGDAHRPEIPGVERIILCPQDAAGAGPRDVEGVFAARTGLRPGDVLLVRPDGHIAARLRSPSMSDLDQAMGRARGVR